MDKQTIEDIFESSGALLHGHFQLTSGLHSETYFQCALVLQFPEYLEKFCREITRYVQKEHAQIDAVIAPAVGGIVVAQEVGRQLGVRSLFAERVEGRMSLRRGFKLLKGDSVLVVEDVITTGGSIREVIELVESNAAKVAGAAAIVDRSGGRHTPIHSLFSVYATEVTTFQPDICPLCREGVPVTKPGSRNLK